MEKHLAKHSSSKDMAEHCQLSDRLLSHYFITFKDRQVYYLARERSKTHGDLLTMIVDSYDKAKVTLPRWPFGRPPKKTIYESVRRALLVNWKRECHKHPLLTIHSCQHTPPNTPIRYINDAYRMHRSWLWRIPVPDR